MVAQRRPGSRDCAVGQPPRFAVHVEDQLHDLVTVGHDQRAGIALDRRLQHAVRQQARVHATDIADRGPHPVRQSVDDDHLGQGPHIDPKRPRSARAYASAAHPDVPPSRDLAHRLAASSQPTSIVRSVGARSSIPTRRRVSGLAAHCQARGNLTVSG